LKIDGSDFLVIGVMPPGFKFPSQTEMWMAAGRWFNRTNRGIRIDQVIARRKSNVTFEQARTEMDTIAARLGAQYPATNADITVAMTPLRDFHVKDIRASLLLLLGACGFVLLIACANVANLLLARATARRREIAIRTALGARRARLVRQMLTESTLLALVGGGFGILLALWAIAALAALIPVELPFWINLNIDWRVIAFTFAVSLVTGLLFGLMPALHSSKLNLNDVLKEGGRSAATWASHRVRSLLVTAEVALAMVLLIGAGLMMKSLMGLHRTNPGFNPQNVLMIGVNLTTDRRQTPEQKAELFRRTLQRIESLPGVESVAANQDLPFVGQMPWNRTSFTIEGQTVDEQKGNPAANVQLVSPAYFNTLSIPLITGRVFDERDVIGSRLSAARWPRASGPVKTLSASGSKAASRTMTKGGARLSVWSAT
jgi:predicted permease